MPKSACLNQRHVRDVELRKRSCAQANTHARLDGIDKMDQIIRSHAALTPMLSCMAAASFFACCSLPLARIGRFGNGASGVLIGVTRNQHPEKHKPKYARLQFGTTARFFSLVLWSSTPYSRETFSICAFACSQCWRWQRQFPDRFSRDIDTAVAQTAEASSHRDGLNDQQLTALVAFAASCRSISSNGSPGEKQG